MADICYEWQELRPKLGDFICHIDGKVASLEALDKKVITTIGNRNRIEEEANLFYHDNSFKIIDDDVLAILISMPNVLITSHQAYLTKEALSNIADTTINNMDEYFNGLFIENELCYKCEKVKNKEECYRNRKTRCF